MDQLLGAQLSRTKILMSALEVAKICDNPVAEQLIKDIRLCVTKSQYILSKTRTVLKNKKGISEELDKLANKCDQLADRAETTNLAVFPSQSFNTSTPSHDNNQLSSTEQSSNGLEVSPCPAAWLNGALESPIPLPGSSHLLNEVQVASTEVQVPRVRKLHPNEMQAVPGYMKGRLTCENVNSFVNTLNSVLKQKYSIALLKRKDVKKKDLVLYCGWKSQEKEFSLIGKVYFTTEDLLNLGNQKLDKMTDKIIQILRHTNRLRQTRINGKLMIYSLI